MIRNRFLGILLVIAMCTALFAGCGNKTESDDASGNASAANDRGTITPATGFDDAGITEIEVSEDATYVFTATDPEYDSEDSATSRSCDWQIYVFNEKYEGDYLDLPASDFDEYYYASVGCEIEAKAGQYLYVYCTQNGVTLASEDLITEGVMLTYTIK